MTDIKRASLAALAFVAVFALAFFAAWDLPLSEWDAPTRFVVGFFALYSAAAAYLLSKDWGHD